MEVFIKSALALLLLAAAASAQDGASLLPEPLLPSPEDPTPTTIIELLNEAIVDKDEQKITLPEVEVVAASADDAPPPDIPADPLKPLRQRLRQRNRTRPSPFLRRRERPAVLATSATTPAPVGDAETTADDATPTSRTKLFVPRQRFRPRPRVLTTARPAPVEDNEIEGDESEESNAVGVSAPATANRRVPFSGFNRRRPSNFLRRKPAETETEKEEETETTEEETEEEQETSSSPVATTRRRPLTGLNRRRPFFGSRTRTTKAPATTTTTTEATTEAATETTTTTTTLAETTTTTFEEEEEEESTTTTRTPFFATTTTTAEVFETTTTVPEEVAETTTQQAASSFKARRVLPQRQRRPVATATASAATVAPLRETPRRLNVEPTIPSRSRVRVSTRARQPIPVSSPVPATSGPFVTAIKVEEEEATVATPEVKKSTISLIPLVTATGQPINPAPVTTPSRAIPTRTTPSRATSRFGARINPAPSRATPEHVVVSTQPAEPVVRVSNTPVRVVEPTLTTTTTFGHSVTIDPNGPLVTRQFVPLTFPTTQQSPVTTIVQEKPRSRPAVQQQPRQLQRGPVPANILPFIPLVKAEPISQIPVEKLQPRQEVVVVKEVEDLLEAPSSNSRATPTPQSFANTVRHNLPRKFSATKPSKNLGKGRIPIVGSYRNRNDDGSLTWGYKSADGSFKEETIGADCITKGRYGYVDPNGEVREFSYQSGVACDPSTKVPIADERASRSGGNRSNRRLTKINKTEGFVDYRTNRFILPSGKSRKIIVNKNHRARG